MSVIVVGGGVAGTAAVHRALSSGRPCTWIQGGIGASAAASGALDWDAAYPNADSADAGSLRELTVDRALSAELRQFGRDVFSWHLPETGVRVVSEQGQIRVAAGADAGVLDLSTLQPGTLAVLDPGKLGWDAERVCSALNQQTWLRAKELLAVPLTLQWAGPTPGISDVHFARALQSDANFVGKLAAALAQLQAERGPVRAVLAGPWLFADMAALSKLRSAAELAELGVALGETLSPPYGIAGQRFEACRATFAQGHAGLQVVAGRAVSVQQVDAGYRVHVEHAQVSQPRHWQAQICILALGGVSSGAVQLDPEHRVRLGVQLEPAQAWQHRGRPWIQPASETGLDLQAFGVELLLELGLAARLGQGALRVVGDLVADQPRSVLRAAQSGLDALA